MAYKMKGSPMQRNFGVGSPMKNEKEYTDEQQRAINRGKIANFNRDNPKASEKEMNAFIQSLIKPKNDQETTEGPPTKALTGQHHRNVIDRSGGGGRGRR